MGCEGCSKGNGGIPAGCGNKGFCTSGGCSKLEVYDWLGNMELPGNATPFEYIEVRFKNGRKEFFKNATSVFLNTGEAIVVEANPGIDVGMVTASGELARLQMEGKRAMKNLHELPKAIRKATAEDIEKWKLARSREEETMYQSRTIAIALGLEMKISDVEYQADNSKAIFYYTADGRVDFRELIKKLAEKFRVRIEMKQIGARQEAGRLGGIGSCGRELCCSTWLTDFRSVSTSAARYQQLSLNTQKLAGQCGKLKCCLNYELDSYLEALSTFPKNYQKLKTKNGVATHLKTDIFKGIIWYLYEEEGNSIGVPVPIHKDKVSEILKMNREDKLPIDLKNFAETEEVQESKETFGNVVGQDSLTRFDNAIKKTKKSRNKKRKKKMKAVSEQKTRESVQNKTKKPRIKSQKPRKTKNRKSDNSKSSDAN